MNQDIELTTKKTFFKIFEKDIKKYIEKTNEKKPLIYFALKFAVIIIDCFSYSELKSQYNSFIKLFYEFSRSPSP
jgi:hypothetical protein